jgi:TolB-like protein
MWVRVFRRWMLAGLTCALMVGWSDARAYEQQLRAASAALGRSIGTAGKKSVAVVDFTDLQMQVTELGRFLAEELQAALLADAKGFVVVDRTHLRVLLQEHKLTSTGIIDPMTARKLGQMAGVDCLVTGSLTPLGDSVRISIKVVDVATAHVIAMLPIDVPKTEAIVTLLNKGIAGAASPEDNAGGGGGGSAPSAPRSTPVTTTVSGFKFDLTSCRRNAGRIACDLRVTNLGDDADVAIYVNPTADGQTRAFDGTGIVRHVTDGRLAGAPAQDGVIRARLISNIPTVMSLSFEGTSTPSFAAIYIRSFLPSRNGSGASSYHDIVLRNVAIGG